MEIAEIRAIGDKILTNIRKNTGDALTYLKNFQCYEHIWLDDKEKSLEMFLEESDEDNDNDIPQSKDNKKVFKNLPKFRQQVNSASELTNHG